MVSPWAVSRYAGHPPILPMYTTGVITQQLLLLPFHLSEPTPLPFRVTHALLTGTLASPIRDRRYGLPIQKTPDGPLTEKQKKELSRPTVEATFDPVWIRDNEPRLQWWLNRMVSGRSVVK